MNSLTSYLIALFAISCYASLSPIAKKLGLDIPKFAFIAICMFILCGFAVTASFLFEKDFSLKSLSLGTWGAMFLFSLINFIGFGFYMYSLKQMPITQYQLIGVLTPVIGGILAYFLLHEPFHWRYLAGLAIMSIGLLVALYDKKVF